VGIKLGLLAKNAKGGGGGGGVFYL